MLVYPLLVLGLLYGEWLLGWFVLGHPPRPTIDDPKFLEGTSWVHPITVLGFFGLLPAACAALVLNVMDTTLTAQKSYFRVGVRLLLLFTIWYGFIIHLSWDPGGIFDWWLD